MATYSQAGRPMRITTPLGEDVLLLDGFEGSEAMSTLFRFSANLLSEKPDIVAADLLRKGVTISVTLDDGSMRYFHGIVNRLSQGGRIEGLTSYRVDIVPLFWTLTLSQDCRIFQKKSVPEIVDEVFGLNGLTDFAVRTTKGYPKREYCVQYRESPFAFVSRLLEEEGIFYFFEHSAGGHTLVLADAPSAIKPCPGQAQARIVPEAGKALAEDVVLTWEKVQELRTGTVALTDYDPLNPSLPLLASAAGKGPDEWFDYPGGYVTVDEGARYTGLQLEEREAGTETVTGSGSVRAFTSGYKFDLREHYRRSDNGSYLLTEVRHIARAGDFRSWTTAPFDYRNTFTAMPAAVPFRPPQNTPKPRIRGTQPAVVTGPSGEEIYPDKYSRVKVQFFWDRYGKKDENSSCWIRVATPWAGKNWGAIHIPRIGQEVMVGYLEGDPDQPIIVGSVYNAEQMPPYALPANMTQSGVKSRSSKAGAATHFNEMRFEDKKGQELLYVHAEKDRQMVVENDNTESVGHDEQVDVGNDRSRSVGHDESISIGNDQSVNVGSDRTETVGNDESVSIGEDRSHTVGRDSSYSVGRDRSRAVGRHETVQVGGQQEVTIAKNRTLTIGDNSSTTIGKNANTTVGKKYVLDVGDEITIKTGDASITMKKNGSIVIKGKDISIEGSGKINVKASGNTVIKGAKVLTN